MASKFKILLIDDEPEIQDLLNTLLRIHGYEGYQAANGLEGIQKAREVRPDLILLDVMMPSLDGFGVQEKLRTDPATKDIPILFISAKAEVENVQKAVIGGAEGYIEKPFDLDTLTAKIQSILEKR